jgi:hypothetical protein
MKPQNRLAMLSEKRIQRIAQKSGREYTQAPPQTLVDAVRQCAEEWNRDHATRHAPTGLLYHYCDAPALLNILKHRKVWATSTKYLNDTTELLTFTSAMRHHADKHRNTPAGETLADMVDFYWISSDTCQTQTIGMDRFACCFSTDGDLLSQWRAYGNNGRGYAIGFDPRGIAGLAETPMMSLRRMTYGDGIEGELVDDLFARFAPVIANHLGILDSTGWGTVHTRNWLSMRFGECLLGMAEEVKHAAFAEEKEWRLYGRGQDVDFRVSLDRIVPYKQLDLTSHSRPGLLPIGEIVIGPRLNYDEAVMSLMSYGSALGYGTGITFRQSRAPYR